MKNIFRFVRCGARQPAVGLGLLFVLFSLFTTTNPLHAQWIQTNGPYGGYIISFAVSPAPAGNLFAGTDGGGVFISTNNGTSWTAASTGLTNTSVYALAVSGTNLFAGTAGGGVFLSTNNGTIWTAVNSGLTNTYVRSLAVSGTNLFAGTYGGGVFLSTNNGTSWTAVNSGLTNTTVRSLAVSPATAGRIRSAGKPKSAAADGGQAGKSTKKSNNAIPFFNGTSYCVFTDVSWHCPWKLK